jgi:hypothetical protein
MHIVGKILILVLMVSAGFGFIIAARLVNTRGDWMKQIQAAKTRNEKSAQDLAAAQQSFEEARAHLEREMLRWDQYFSPVNGVFDSASKAIIANAGKTIGIRPNLELYAFQLGNGGSSTFVGSFSAAEVRDNESALKSTFPVRAADIPEWNGQSWRFRTVIPSAFVSRIAGLQSELGIADELLKKQENNLATQTELAKTAREQRDGRIAELLGAAGDGGQAAGLVAEINQADDQRNASLLRVDDLRRKIKEAEGHVTTLIQENSKLATLLPGQPPRQQAEAGNSGK